MRSGAGWGEPHLPLGICGLRAGDGVICGGGGGGGEGIILSTRFEAQCPCGFRFGVYMGGG